jgi:putative DNA primase/helicase
MSVTIGRAGEPVATGGHRDPRNAPSGARRSGEREVIGPDLDSIPDFLTALPRWLVWRNESRSGRPTKVPKTVRNTNAASTRPDTWAPFASVALALRRQPYVFDGPGIVLGDLDSGEHLCGVDLDGALDEDGTLAEWARPIVAVLPTYGEISPNGRGLKFFFRCGAADARTVRLAFGISGDAWGCKRTIGANGADHGPAVEVYIGPGRYFTVTGKQWGRAPDDVALFDRDGLQRLAALMPNPAAGVHGTGGDNSRSAIAFRKGAALRRRGKTFPEMCIALHADPETADWCREKGDANGGRELARIWQRAAPSGAKPVIRVIRGQRHENADAGLDALHAAGVAFYQRDRNLVRVCAIKAKAADGSVVHVPAVTPVTPPVLGRVLGQAARWESVNRKGEATPIDPPKEIVEQIGAMIEEWPFAPLHGVIGTPTLRPDGSLLTTEGYDPATGLVLFAPPPMPPIPPEPTKRDALDALATLNGLLVDFPFAEDQASSDGVNRSVAMSMLMTPVLRAAMMVVPMHVVTAPTAGTGKSFLADLAAVLATGDRCPVISVSAEPAETEKRLIAAALAQHPIVLLDNVTGLLFGDFLCQATERPTLQIRPLGTSNEVRIVNTFSVFANGNNLTIAADNVRRTIQCALDANREDPEAREFTSNPVASVLADRGKYVAAALTIARAYGIAGRPGCLPPLPSYEGWSNTVRSALVWLGWPDPVASNKDIQAADPIRQQRTALFGAWRDELAVGDSHQAGGYQVGELVKYGEEYIRSDRLRPALFDALYSVAPPRTGHPQIDPHRLGRWLNSNLGTIANGHKLTVDRTDARRPRWRLIVT